MACDTSSSVRGFPERPSRSRAPYDSDLGIQELPLEQIQVPHIQAAYRHWQERRGQRRMPALADIDIASADAALGFTGLIEVAGEPATYRHRLFGSLMATAQGGDYTGLLVNAIRPEGYARMLERSYAGAVRRAEPIYHHIHFERDSVRRAYFRLMLPLSEDGTQVTLIWATTHYYSEYQRDRSVG